MSKKTLSVAVIFSLLVLFAAASVSAQTTVTAPATQPATTVVSAPATQPAATAAPAPAAQSAATAAPAPANTAVPAAGSTSPVQTQFYQNQGYRAVSARDFFGFDGIPFNGSHRAAFLRWRASRGGF